MASNAFATRRGFLIGGAAAIGATALGVSGCTVGGSTGSSSSGSSTGSKTTGKLTVMGYANEVTKDLISQWNTANPDSPVTLIASDQTRLNAMLAAGNPPDLVRDFGATATAYLASRKLALDLDPYIANSSILKESELAKINDVWRWDGNVQGQGARYGIVKDYSQDAMYWYNEDQLSAANVTPPTSDKPATYAELLDQAQSMTTRKNGKVTQYGLFTTNPSLENIASMVATTGGKVFSDDLSTADFTSPEVQSALQWFVDVAKAKVGYSLTDPNPEGWDGPPFGAKRVSLAGPAGYWFGGYVASTKGMDEFARLAPAPLLGSTRVSPTTSATGYWISAKTKNPDGAFAFLEWYCAGDPAKERAQSGWGLPAVNTLIDQLPTSKAYQKAALATQQAENEYFGVITFSPYAQATAISAAVASVFPKAVTGDLSVGQLGDQVTTAVNKLLATGKQLAGK